jgi:VanZ family protein
MAAMAFVELILGEWVQSANALFYIILYYNFTTQRVAGSPQQYKKQLLWALFYKYYKNIQLHKHHLIYENKYNYQEQQESGVARLRAVLHFKQIDFQVQGLLDS